MGDGLFVHGGVTSALEARLALAGLIALQGSGLDARTGVLSGPGTTTLITGTAATAPMQVAVAVHDSVLSRGVANGPYVMPTEAVQLVDIGAAPASGTRIDVVYEKQQDSTAGVPTPDATTGPLYGVLAGVADAGKPDLSTVVGAVELGTVAVSAGATATNGAGVLITNTAGQTVARGARIPVRTQADRDALTAFPGLEVYRLDTGQVQLCTAAGPPAQWTTVFDPAWNTNTLLPLVAANWRQSTLYQALHISARGNDVRIRGTVENVNAVAGAFTSLVVGGGGIPAALRPTVTVQRPVMCTYSLQSAAVDSQRANVYTDGGLELVGNVTGGAGLSWTFDLSYTSEAV